MVDILTFEKDGFTYAKGFNNQEGLTFYVLPDFLDALNEVLDAVVLPGKEFWIEPVNYLPS